MKTLKTLSLLLVLLCCGQLANAQCGIYAGWTFTINPNNVHVFTDTSYVIGGYQISNHYWSFGDGSTSNLANPTHQFTTPGHYNVCEYVIGSQSGGTNQCIDTFCHEILVCGTLQAAISANVQGTTVVFTGTGSSTASPVAYHWTFAGGTPSSSSTPVTTVTYALAGVHQACLTISDSLGCSTTTCQNVTSIGYTSCANANASFTTSTTGPDLQGMYHLIIQENSTISNTACQTLTVNGFVQSYYYGANTALDTLVAAGTYNICVKIYANCSTAYLCDSFCQSVVVGCNTVSGDFTFTSGLNGVVAFTPNFSSNYPPLTFEWNFGDGTTSTDQSPTHTYNTPGAYNVCVTVTDANGCAKHVCHSVGITSGVCGTLNANFTATASGNTVTLSSTSTGTNNNTLYQWWKDGVAITNPNPNTAFTVTGVTYGTHTFCLYLYATNTSTFCDSSCQTVTVTSCGVSAAFQASVSGNVATFYANGNPSGNHSYWTFGDGTTSNDTVTVLHHTYPASTTAVVYHVCHYVYMPGVNCVDSLCESVTIPGTASNCGTASFSIAQSSGHLTLTATGAVSGNQFVWAIRNANGVGVQTGSGNPFTSSTLTNGTYQVCLYLYSSTQILCDSSCQTISVTSGCPNFYVVIQDSLNANGGGLHTLKAVPYGTTSSYTFAWSNGATTQSITVQPGATYCVTVTNSSACVADACFTIPSSSCGTASFTMSQSNGHLILTSTSIGATSNTSYSWVIRNSSGTAVQTGSGSPFTSATLQNGTYNVCLYLYASNTVLCDSECHSVTITSSSLCSGLSAQWTQTYNTANNSVTFTSSNQMTGAVYHWSFGDGQISTSPSPTHSYANSGLYNVCLVVEIPGTVCRDSSCHSIQANAGTTCHVTATIHSTLNSNGSYTLTVAATTNILAYSWSTGAHTQDIVVTAPGVYCVTIEDANGCHGDDCDTIGTNTCNITAAFQYIVHTSWVSFYPAANSTSGLHAYWNFGDGTTSTDSGSFITHTFPASANTVTYNVCHYVYIAGTNCATSFCQQVTVPGTGSNCGAASFTSTVANNQIHATSTSTGVGATTHYYWNIYGANGNLIQTQSGLDNFIVSQTLPGGTYLVCLYIYGNSTTVFCDSACQNVTIANPNPCSGLNADFTQTYLSTGGVQFQGISSSNTVTDYWSFGDGTSSTNHDPIHNYTTGGLYTVCHIVAIPGSVCADTSCQQIQATGSNPCAGFSVHINASTNSTGLHGLEAVITGGGPTDYYHWSNSATTAAIYPTAAGVYCVTVYDNNQCSAVACDTFVPVNPNPCHASFSYVYVNCNTVHFANASSGGFTNQTWNFGDGTSSSNFDPTHTFPVGTWTVQLTVYTNGGSCQSTYYQVITIQPCGGNDDTICGTVFIDLNGNGVQDSGEQGYTSGTIYAGTNHSTHPDANGHYMLIVPAGTYTLYFCAPSGYTFTIPVGTVSTGVNATCATYTLTTNGSSNCGYDFGIQNNTVTICGTVYFDANNNHQQDPNSEAGIANVEVHLTASNGTVYTAHTDQNGHYCITLPAGVYVITVASNVYTGGTVTPQSITLTTVAGTNYYHNDFGVYTQPGACDLAINITPHTTVTAGYPAWYDIEVCNVGAGVSNGTVNLFFDPNLAFNYSSPAQTSVNNSTHTATWTITNILPGSCNHYWVDFDADSNLAVGHHIFMLANVTTTGCNESNFNNNVDTTHQEATASWDPNNKLVLPLGVGVEGKIAGDQELTYTINFQNTGNAPAVNVVVRDMIDNDLDIETFRMISASHPYTMQFAGREAIWKFSAIQLPDSNTNEAASHGYVTFAITPAVGLAEGTQLTNMANIYFDYNTAVPTNSTLNTIDYRLSVRDIENGSPTIALMPNPFKDFTTIKIDGDNASYELRVFDVLGNLVRRDISSNNTFTVQRETMAAGVYMYEIVKSNKVIGKGKMIAE